MINVVDLEQDLHFTAGDDDFKMEAPAPATAGVAENPTGFDAMDEDMGTINTKDILWLDDDNTNLNHENLLDDNSIFYNNLPDFSCMPSSSSTPAAANPPSGQDVTMDLICNEMWDPSSIFQEPSQEESDGFASFLQGHSELSSIFFEWLKQNRHHISAEDMRSIKLKRSTIESASDRLGTDREGKKQLLKLILEWVEQNHLLKKRAFSQNPNPNFMYSGPHPSPMTHQVVSQIPYQGMVQPQLNHFPNNGNVMNYQQTVNGNPNGEKFVGLGLSATKEARKKRMARQRKSNQHNRNRMSDVPRGEDRDGSDSPEGKDVVKVWKSEKNLKFLLQKVLKQSDVGSLGRIVLPKKEAERHLPELETSDGITIPIEDIGTSRVWSMRYRFWPNNKSRMYVLENTGDFVRLNGLEEGDFIVLYSHTKCSKYMIRGIKVREPDTKTEGKKPTKQNMSNISSFK
ncbi:B3 domain-containing transcription factor [Castilleja foliolosa]|uniref:B3 domain-containing transcription factor n=1 Tax=Castilleja foliolosa TaxID=1961234 RepID=A0ABD3E3L2_9LAMI